MKTKFERSLHNNYMVIMDEEENFFVNYADDYQVRMLSGKGVCGFLSLKVRYFNGRAELCYDISAKQKMSDWFKTKKINYVGLRGILSDVCEAFESEEEYLLDERHIILNPDYIFADTDDSRIFLCYCPFYEEDIIKSGQEFLQYLLEILDYNDKAAVELGYEVFRLCMKDGFGVGIIKHCLESENATVVTDNEAEEWNSVVPVSVMNEEVEEEYEKSLLPYLSLPVRKKICIGLVSAEIVLSVIMIPMLLKLHSVLILYLLFSVIFIGGVLAASVFYNRLQLRFTRIVGAKGYIAYDDKSDGYIYEEEVKIPEDKPEETVLLAYTGKVERYKRLHYIGTRQQEDIILTNYPFTVGKAESGNDYCLSYPFVSRVHFRIDKDEDGRYYITDANSRNGLLINDVSLNATETREIFPGDRIELGDLVFLFQ